MKPARTGMYLAQTLKTELIVEALFFVALHKNFLYDCTCLLHPPPLVWICPGLARRPGFFFCTPLPSASMRRISGHARTARRTAAQPWPATRRSRARPHPRRSPLRCRSRTRSGSCTRSARARRPPSAVSPAAPAATGAASPRRGCSTTASRSQPAAAVSPVRRRPTRRSSSISARLLTPRAGSAYDSTPSPSRPSKRVELGEPGGRNRTLVRHAHHHRGRVAAGERERGVGEALQPGRQQRGLLGGAAPAAFGTHQQHAIGQLRSARCAPPRA